VISAAVESKSYALALIAMLAAVVTAFFYLRVILLMYSPLAPDAESPALAIPFGAGLVLISAVAFTLLAGILPGAFFDFAKHATLLF
jgi:NADH-quinone oxidoreductase subunit N